MTPQVVIKLLALLTLMSNMAIVIFLSFVMAKSRGLATKHWNKFLKFVSGKEIILSLIVALTATLGSLYFSEVAGFQPCTLCWYQRILMYPLVLILGVALFRSKKVSDPEGLRPGRDVWNYVLPLSISGLLIAGYHYYYQITGNPLLPCSTIGFSVSCSERFFTYFGYITIPWMSLSAFILITIGMLLLRMKNS